MKLSKFTASLAIGLLLTAGSVFAQGQQMMKSSKADSITDQELEHFASVTQEFQKIQQDSRQKVQSMLSDTDMDMQRFQKIMMSKRNPKMADSVEVTPKEQKTMKELQPKLMKMQQQSRKKMIAAIQENDLSPQRFQAISRAVRTKPAVMKRFQKIAQDTANSQN